MKTRSNQTWFNKTYRHHILYGNPAGYDDAAGQCAYGDTPQDAQCAIGCSLTLAERNKGVKLEQTGSGGVRSLIDAGVIEGDIDFLVELQSAHDGSHFLVRSGGKDFKERYEEKLRGLALDYKSTSRGCMNLFDPLQKEDI